MPIITLNGEIKEVTQECCIEDLIAEADLLESRYAVEVNEEIVPRSKHKLLNFTDNDVVEIVTAVGGG